MNVSSPLSCFWGVQLQGASSNAFSWFSCDPQKYFVCFSNTWKKRLLMVSAAYVSSLGPAEESPSGLFLPCPPAQLCSSLWQMAEPDLSQVTALCQHLELCLEALGPPGSALGPVLPLHSHLLRQSQAIRTAPVSAPAANHGLWYRLSILLSVQFNKEVSLQNPGLHPNFFPELLGYEFTLVCL